jgi:hypothetical protein
MKQLKLAILFAGMFSLSLSSCEKTDEGSQFSKKGSPMTGAQVVPANPTSASTAAKGTIDASYDKKTKLLTYTLNWSGLTAAPLPTVLSSSVPVQAGIYIHGPADPGYFAFPSDATSTPPLLYLQAPVQVGTVLGTSGTFTGTFYIDGVKIKEEEVLGNKLYAVIRTSATTQPATSGEIRGQIILR